MRRLAIALALLLTPLAHGASFPPFGRHALAWVAFVPWFAAIRLTGPGAALALTSTVTFAGSAVVASWLPRAVANYYGQPFAVGIVLFVGVWTVTVAPFVLGFTLAYRALGRLATPLLPLLAAAAWTANELARVELLVGNPFGLLGYSQVGVLPLLQIAAGTGVYGITFILAAVNAGLAEVWVAAATGAGRRTARVGLGLAVLAAAGAGGYGRLALGAAERVSPAALPPAPVAVVQGALDLGAQWRQDMYGRNLEEYLRLTAEVLGRTRPALVVWPESAMTFFLEREPLYRAAIARVLVPHGAELLAGGPRVEDEGAPRYYNSAFVLAPTGALVARYDKERLLPFAEYFPFGSGLLRREFARVREFTPGADGGTPLPTAAGPAGVVICNEAMFPRLVARRVRDGAALLVNLTNDSWLGDTQYSLQALDMARVRAVEQRRWVIRASTSGPSALIDPFGRVVEATVPDVRATLAGTVRPEHGSSSYGAWGDAFGLGCVLVTAVAVAAGLRRAVPAWAESRGRRVAA